MSLFEAPQLLLVVVLGLLHQVVPVLVKLLVFEDVSLLHLLTLSGLVIEQLLTSAVEVLQFKLSDPILGHFSLYTRVGLDSDLVGYGRFPQVRLKDTYLRIFPRLHRSFCGPQALHYTGLEGIKGLHKVLDVFFSTFGVLNGAVLVFLHVDCIRLNINIVY